MRKLLISLFLLSIGYSASVFSSAGESGKDFFVEMVADICSKHEDPGLCRWQVENISAISSINTLTYYGCKLRDKKGKECLESIEMFDYIQGQYDKNMRDITNK
ncbi:hypothetical protein [Providencia stuartii]|uniref:hypothetical protein n=1 Tax=Providencia stuartii TaxID=588 RepID=UPI00333430E9